MIFIMSIAVCALQIFTHSIDNGNQLASFVVSHTTDAAHRYSTLIPIITVLYAVVLVSIIAVTLATKGKSANALSSR